MQMWLCSLDQIAKHCRGLNNFVGNRRLGAEATLRAWCHVSDSGSCFGLLCDEDAGTDHTIGDAELELCCPTAPYDRRR